jgi:4-hydroxybenzoate polyprenyltransferase
MGAAAAHPSKLNIYLQLGRVSNLPTVWTNVLAGLVLAGGPVSFRRVAVLGAAMSCFYVGGMFLNDAFDREHDRRERPDRPIPGGLATVREVLIIGFSLLVAGLLTLGFLATHSGWPLLAGGWLLALLIVFYDLHHKGNPLSPLVMAGCRAMIYLIAAWSLAPILPSPVLIGAAALFSYIIGLSVLARYETAPRPGPLWPFVFLWAPFVAPLAGVTWSSGTALLMAGLLGWLAFITWRTIQGEGARVRQATGFWLSGISLLDAALIVGQGRLDLAISAVLGSGVAGKLQQRIRGT